jgi:hypothetical protein
VDHYSQREFFSTVLSSEGMPCVARLVHGGKKSYFEHVVYESIADMCDALDTTDFRTHNYYFCISTLASPSIVTADAEGKEVRRVRVQKNMLRSRAFVLDIDIRDKEGFYRNMEDALEGVDSVRDAFGLPDPILVDSGFGLHVYWPMMEGIDSVEWSKIAAKFKKAISVVAPEVVADGSRVSDQAGVLRIPNSFNLKGEDVAVRIVQWYSDFVDAGQLRDRLNMIVPDELNTTLPATSIVYDSGPVELKKVAKNCNWVGTYLKDAAKASEPEWYAILGLVPYMQHTTDNGALVDSKLAHALSKKHPQYDAQATYDKYIQAKLGQTGPTTCNRFRSIIPERCEGCPFAETVRTPLGTARLDTPSVGPTTVKSVVVSLDGTKTVTSVTIPAPPIPYFRGEEGGVYVRTKVKKEDNTWENIITRVYDYDLYPVRRFRTETLETEAIELHVHLPRDGMRSFKLPNALLADGKSLARFLSEKGVVPEFGKLAPLAKYLIDYVRHMQIHVAAETEFARFGWREVLSAEPKFVLGDGVMTVDGKIEPATHAEFLDRAASTVKAKGNLDVWKQGFNVYKDMPHSEAFVLAAMVGFAAPLFALTPYNGVLYNMVGHSSAGKSTAMKVMTSVFGEPIESHILSTDTDISTFNFIGYLNSVPVSFDELTNLDGERLSNFALNFTSGRGKMRAGRDGQNRPNETTWDTIVVSSSNTSLYDKLASHRKGYNAEAMRIFELTIGASDPQYKEHVDTHLRLLQDNYGVAGREYLGYLMPRISKIKDLIEKTTVALTARGRLRNEERFWGALLACVLVGGTISKRLGLHTYDVDKLVDWCLGLSEEVRATITSVTSDPVSTLSEFFNSNLNSILHMEGKQQKLSGMSGAMHSVKVRMEYEANELVCAYISAPALREYCKLRSIDPSWLRAELVQLGIVHTDMEQVRLTTGTSLPAVNTRTWRVDMQHERLSGLQLSDAAQAAADKAKTE